MTLPGRTSSRRRLEHLAMVAVIAAAGAMVTFVAGRSAAQTPTGVSSGPPRPGPSAVPSNDLGERLYLRDCAWCHVADGGGSDRGPSLIGVGAASVDFMLSTGRMPIDEPMDNPPRRPPRYTRAGIQAITRVVASFGPGPPVPAVDPAAGSLAEGQQLYELNCAACHSSTGAGGALTNGLVAPDLRSSSAEEVAEAIRIGGAGLHTGNMPRFDPDTLSDAQLDSVTRYVLALRQPVPGLSDRVPRGGVDLDRLGPVAEGFVAWFVGLLLLVLFVRFIGTRANE